jgi:glycosyltransferase involved in cell wall biosynthesis
MEPTDPAVTPDMADQKGRSVTISAVMIAKDAEKTIEAALGSVRFCDEIIVLVDSTSSDETERIARRRADPVELRGWAGFGPAKRAAVAIARGQWVLSIDADEQLTSELADSITEAIRRSRSDAFAYSVRRRTRFLGRWMRHGDWGRDRVVRLFRRDKGEITGETVHESVAAPGPKPVLRGLMLHEGDQNLSAYLARLDRYTSLAARSLFDSGRRASWLALVLRPLFKFVQAYILRLGCLDGWQGFVLAWYSAVYVFSKYAKLTHLRRSSS